MRSYWMYLMHMPVVMLFQMALAPLAWTAAVKVPIVVMLAFPALVLSYDLLVRATWIGALLNGRVYARWFASEIPAPLRHGAASPAVTVIPVIYTENEEAV